MSQFKLEPFVHLPSAQLPGGFKQRLAMAAALLHRPEILFLDEPTSGADPFARREFWQRITALAANGVTVIVTTHFMAEAEYCDRAAILDNGKVLAQGTPAELRATRPPRQAIKRRWRTPSSPLSWRRAASRRANPGRSVMNGWSAKLRRIRALTLKETRQIIRDPSSIAIGIVFPLMMICSSATGSRSMSPGFPSPWSTKTPPRTAPPSSGLSGFRRISGDGGSLDGRGEYAGAEPEGGRSAAIPSDFTRRWHSGGAEVQILVNGTDANQARIMQGYAQGPVALWSAAQAGSGPRLGRPGDCVDRMWFNESNDSHYFLVPGLIVLVMTIIGAFLTAMVVAREWERGTLEALFVTPMRPGEFLISKLVPYFGLGMIGFVLCLLAGQFLFPCPSRGSLFLLCLASMIYLLVALGIGLLVSTLVKSQFLASQLAMTLTFLPAMMLSGFLYDLRSMPAFHPGNHLCPAGEIRGDADANPVSRRRRRKRGLAEPGVLAAMAAALLVLTRLATRKQLS
jgi:ABC-2 type transport system permease protein